MADTFNKTKRSSIMRAIKSKGTTPEMYVRRALHAQGFRYRLHAKQLPGKPDLTFARTKTVVFVNGCFWHWHGCPRSRMPKSNTEYWQKKIGRNVQRDQRNHELLRSEGWSVVVIWECELDTGLVSAAKHLRSTRRLSNFICLTDVPPVLHPASGTLA